MVEHKDTLEFELPAWDAGSDGAAALAMKIRDNDVFYTVDIPILRIRPCTPTEAAARAKRWAQSGSFRLEPPVRSGESHSYFGSLIETTETANEPSH